MLFNFNVSGLVTHPGTADLVDILRILGGIAAQSLGVSGLLRNEEVPSNVLQKNKSCVKRC